MMGDALLAAAKLFDLQHFQPMGLYQLGFLINRSRACLTRNQLPLTIKPNGFVALLGMHISLALCNRAM